jgi:hypothetical protein
MRGPIEVAVSGGVGAIPMDESPPATYDWSWRNQFASVLRRFVAEFLPSAVGLLVPWAIMLALLTLRENRCRAARLVFVVTGATLVVCAVVLPIFNGAPRYHVVLTPFLAWIGMVWLLADRLARLRALLMLGAVTGLAGFAGTVAAVAMSIELFGGERAAFEAFAAFAVVVHMGAMMGARAVCRRQFTWRKFLRWTLLWHLALPQILGLPCLAYGLASGDTAVAAMLWGMVTVGGVAVWTLQTPLMALLVMSPVLRSRVMKLFRLPDAQA